MKRLLNFVIKRKSYLKNSITQNSSGKRIPRKNDIPFQKSMLLM